MIEQAEVLQSNVNALKYSANIFTNILQNVFKYSANILQIFCRLRKCGSIQCQCPQAGIQAAAAIKHTLA